MSPYSLDSHMDNLRKTKKLLDSLKVPFFLSHGSLLGWYRECGVIAHTQDMDVGIPYICICTVCHNYCQDMSKHADKIKEEMLKIGFKLVYWYGSLEKGYELSFRRRNAGIDVSNVHYHSYLFIYSPSIKMSLEKMEKKRNFYGI